MDKKSEQPDWLKLAEEAAEIATEDTGEYK